MTPGRETGSLRLDTRRLARQQTWDHLKLIKRNYNNYIKIVQYKRHISLCVLIWSPDNNIQFFA